MKKKEENEIEKGNFKSIKDLESMKKKYKAYAINTLKKDIETKIYRNQKLKFQFN